MIYGYCRISTKQQSIERQIRNILEAYPKAKLYQEAYTGTTQDRPEWMKLLKNVKPGDTIVFDSVSRMSRDAAEGFKQYEELYNKGIELVFLKEAYINTSVYAEAKKNSLELTGNEIADCYIKATNKVLMILARNQIQIAFDQAEKEVKDLRERTSEGIKTAKLNGKKVGRQVGAEIVTKKSAETKAMILAHSRDFGGTLTDAECIKLAGVSRNSFYKYKAELKK